MKISKKTEEAIKNGLPKFQKILSAAKARDLNESDTVAIITDILAEVFGYEKYVEITSELAIRGTYCDLAIKIEEKFQYLIECKAIGIDLKEAHIRQATGYGANKGIEWVVLTNGSEWRVYKLKFEQPLSWDCIFSLDLATVNLRDPKTLDQLFALSKEGVIKDARAEIYAKAQFVNRYTVAHILQTEAVIKTVQKSLKALIPDVKTETAEIASLLRESILRRDTIESEEAAAAKATIVKLERKAARKASATEKADNGTPNAQA